MLPQDCPQGSGRSRTAANMNPSFWLKRWKENRIGFHQSKVNDSLVRYWPPLASQSRVLVPLCGKSLDLLWLVEQGCNVTGIELSPLAVEAFFEEQGIDYETSTQETGVIYRAREKSLRIFGGDFFEFEASPFDALYDRAALISLPQEQRRRYTDRCRRLLSDNASVLLVTLEYDQQQMHGPPYSVPGTEVATLWGERLQFTSAEELIENEPRFKRRGLDSLIEKTWLGQR